MFSAFFAALWISSSAVAQTPCPGVAEQITAAWDAYDEAELKQARTAVRLGVDALECQTDIVPTDKLVELFRLDALVSISMDDQPGATYGTIRAVVADPEAPPPDDFGPALVELYNTWHGRLRQGDATIKVVGGGVVYVDGHQVESNTFEVLQGEHLIQVTGGTETESLVLDITGAYTLETGLEEELPGVETSATEPTAAIGEGLTSGTGEQTAAILPATRTATESAGHRKPKKRSRAAPGLVIAGGVTAALGGGAILAGFLQHQKFNGDPYDAATYGDCSRGAACYGQARAEAIDRDSTMIRALYGSGYGLVGAGVAVAGVGAVLFIPMRGGGGLGIQVPL